VREKAATLARDAHVFKASAKAIESARHREAAAQAAVACAEATAKLQAMSVCLNETERTGSSEIKDLRSALAATVSLSH